MHNQTTSSALQFHVTSNMIAASAGTGKTYQLASRYIALLVLGAKPEEIIALTFTRKAAGEFRNRILHALAEGACWKADEYQKGARNPLTVRVWDVLSGLSINAEGRAVPAGNPVALLPPTAALVRLAEEKGCFPEDLYHEDAELQAYYRFDEPNADTFARLLKQMVAVLSRLKLTTIDSFFASLVTTNSMELGMNSAEPLDPADEANVEAAAIREYLDIQGTDEQSRAEFLRMFSLLTDGVGNKTQTKIASELKTFLSLYHFLPASTLWGNVAAFGVDVPLHVATAEEYETYQEHAEQLRYLLYKSEPGMMDATSRNQLHLLSNGALTLGKTAAKLLETVRENYPYLQELVFIQQNIGRQNEEMPQLQSAAEKALPAPQLYGWSKGAAEVLAKLSVSKQCNDKAKQNSFRKAVESLIQSSRYNKVLLEVKHLALLLQEEAVPCRLRAVSEKSAAMKTLLDGYAENYEKRMRTDGKLTFADMARMANALMRMDNADARLLRHHVAYRMGAELHHWMLDEFQDTSEDQFATLQPLLSPIAEDAGAHEEDFADEEWQAVAPASLQGRLVHQPHHVAADSIFVVGDVKQSIYGFRTGKTEAFDRLKSDPEWSTALRHSRLTQSFRSSPVIMGKEGFINTLFDALHHVECSEDELSRCIEKEPVTSLPAFTGHLAAKNIPGYVEISVVAPPNKDDLDDDSTLKTRIYNAIIEQLGKLTDADSRPINNMSIAILVRSNTEADEIMAHLATKMPALPRLLVKDSLVAADSPLGEMLLYFFRWLQHPADAAALGVVRASFLGKLFMKSKVAPKRAELLDTLQHIGYAALLEQLLELLDAADCRKNHHTITLWKNSALSADIAGLSLAEWVNHMKKLSVQGVSNAGAVQIMTMHKSKGLEFDAVILPYCSKEAVDSTKHLEYLVTDDASSILLPPGKTEELPILDEPFTGMVAQWQKEQRREAYNLLYVAATRAKYANYIICHGQDLIDKINKTTQKFEWKSAARSTAGLIRQAVAYLTQDLELLGKVDKNQVIYTHPEGDSNWFEHLKVPVETEPQAQQDTHSALGDAIPRRSRVRPSSLAKDEAKPQHDAHANPATRHSNSSTGMDFGTDVHLCWEDITWANAETLQRLKTAAVHKPECQVVYDALQQPDIRALFTEHPGQEVYNEQHIEAITCHNEWLSGTIDRLVLTTDATGQPIAAHIIDFKTNTPCAKKGYASFYEWLSDYYAGQMQPYKQLIYEAFGLPSKDIRVSLVSCPKDSAACVLTYADEKLPIEMKKR